MSTEELVRAFLDKGGEITKIPKAEPVPPKKHPARSSKWAASKAFRYGGKYS